MEDKQLQYIKSILVEHLNDHIKQIEASREHTNQLIEDTIRVVVNGKIDKINAQNVSMEKKMDEFIGRATPAVDFFDNINFTKRMFMHLLIGIATFGAAFAAIKQFISKE